MPTETSALTESPTECAARRAAVRSAWFYIRKVITLALGATIAAIGLQLFLIPNEVIDGGVVGLAIMGQAVTGLPFGVFLVGLNLPFLWLGYKQIGKSFALWTSVAIVLLSIISPFFEPIPGITDDVFLAAIFGGVIDGIGVGIIMRAGGSLDGTEITAIVLDRKSAFSVGEIVMFFNLFILSGAGLLFGWDNAMYSLFAYFVISKMIDVVLKGFDESYSAMIVTSHETAVADALLHRLGRGVTIIHGAGGYSGEKREILYSVVSRLEVGKLKEVVLEEDPDAFVTINAVHDIVGGRLKKRPIH